MIFVTDICKLTEDFINDYPKAKYPELMNKLGCPYSCLLVDTKKNYFICIPFRSHISHKNSFMFHGLNVLGKISQALIIQRLF